MSDPTDVADSTNWYGGLYELAIDFGTSGDESVPRLAAALSALWAHPTLDGCYASKEVPASSQQRVAPTLDPIDHPRDYYGVATLPN